MNKGKYTFARPPVNPSDFIDIGDLELYKSDMVKIKKAIGQLRQLDIAFATDEIKVLENKVRELEEMVLNYYKKYPQNFIGKN